MEVLLPPPPLPRLRFHLHCASSVIHGEPYELAAARQGIRRMNIRPPEDPLAASGPSLDPSPTRGCHYGRGLTADLLAANFAAKSIKRRGSVHPLERQRKELLPPTE